MMKIQSIVLISALLFAARSQAAITTPTIDSPLVGNRDTTLASIDEPEVEEGSTPDGVSADQVFQEKPSSDSLLVPVTAGVDNDEPVLSGRKMLAGRKMLDDLSLTGNGVSAGAAGAGVTETLSGHGQTDAGSGGVSDTHIEPHEGQTTVTADGKSVSYGVGVDPDNLAGEDQAVVFTTSGRK